MLHAENGYGFVLASPEKAVCDMLSDFIMNPVAIGAVIMAFIGVFTDPTTAGMSDSAQAMTYTEPKK